MRDICLGNNSYHTSGMYGHTNGFLVIGNMGGRREMEGDGEEGEMERREEEDLHGVARRMSQSYTEEGEKRRGRKGGGVLFIVMNFSLDVFPVGDELCFVASGEGDF